MSACDNYLARVAANLHSPTDFQKQAGYVTAAVQGGKALAGILGKVWNPTGKLAKPLASYGKHTAMVGGLNTMADEESMQEKGFFRTFADKMTEGKTYAMAAGTKVATPVIKNVFKGTAKTLGKFNNPVGQFGRLSELYLDEGTRAAANVSGGARAYIKGGLNASRGGVDKGTFVDYKKLLKGTDEYKAEAKGWIPKIFKDSDVAYGKSFEALKKQNLDAFMQANKAHMEQAAATGTKIDPAKIIKQQAKGSQYFKFEPSTSMWGNPSAKLVGNKGTQLGAWGFGAATNPYSFMSGVGLVGGMAGVPGPWSLESELWNDKSKLYKPFENSPFANMRRY